MLKQTRNILSILNDGYSQKCFELNVKSGNNHLDIIKLLPVMINRLKKQASYKIANNISFPFFKYIKIVTFEINLVSQRQNFELV